MNVDELDAQAYQTLQILMNYHTVQSASKSAEICGLDLQTYLERNNDLMKLMNKWYKQDNPKTQDNATKENDKK